MFSGNVPSSGGKLKVTQEMGGARGWEKRKVCRKWEQGDDDENAKQKQYSDDDRERKSGDDCQRLIQKDKKRQLETKNKFFFCWTKKPKCDEVTRERRGKIVLKVMTCPCVYWSIESDPVSRLWSV